MASWSIAVWRGHVQSLDSRARRPVTHSFFPPAKFTRGGIEFSGQAHRHRFPLGRGVRSLAPQERRPGGPSRVCGRIIGESFLYPTVFARYLKGLQTIFLDRRRVPSPGMSFLGFQVRGAGRLARSNRFGPCDSAVPVTSRRRRAAQAFRRGARRPIGGLRPSRVLMCRHPSVRRACRTAGLPSSGCRGATGRRRATRG